MKKLPKPPHLPHEVFATCISTVADPDLKSRLQEIALEIVGASIKYESLAQNVELHKFPAVKNIGRVKAAQLKNVYTTRMVKKNYPGRQIYDEIRLAPEQDLCPLCNAREIKQLDHHLPKSIFPILSVIPLNLIPVCKECNELKKCARPNSQADQTFHPYFDDFESERWLWATVIAPNLGETKPGAVIFEVRQPQSWNNTKFARLANQFKVLDLAALYTTRAATDLRNLQYRLSNLHAKGGPDAVRKHLIADYESCFDADRNSWQTAMYNALADSFWYCDGGFIVR